MDRAANGYQPGLVRRVTSREIGDHFLLRLACWTEIGANSMCEMREKLMLARERVVTDHSFPLKLKLAREKRSESSTSRETVTLLC